MNSSGHDRLVYIGGAGRSGSTLLDLLLNNHPLVASLGEVHRLGWYARDNHETCTCGQPVADCPFWQSVAAEITTLTGDSGDVLRSRDPMLRPQDLPRLTNLVEKGLLVAGHRGVFGAWARRWARPHHEALENSLLWYEGVRRVTGCPVVIDSTKDPRRLKALYLADPERYRLIFLVRDGRAVSASAMRREGVSMTVAARSWLSANRRSLWNQASIPDALIHQLRYEDLCEDPRKAMTGVCEFLEIDFDPVMLELRKEVAHNVGGNPMRFRTGERGIVLDERWKEQLDADDLATFDRIAGSMNRKFGYRQNSNR